MPINPATPITFWALLTVGFVAVTTLVPLLVTLRQLRKMKETDSVRELSLQLEEPAILKKVAMIIAQPIADAIREHDALAYSHAQALARYPSMEQFNGALKELRAEVAGVKALIESTERSRTDHMVEIRRLISDSALAWKSEFDELRSNVAKAVGGRPL